MLRGSLVEDADGLEVLRDAWDELAEAAARPFAAPGWCLPWLRHAAPPGARVRAVAVHDGQRLAGIAPLVAVRRKGVTVLSPLAAHVSHRVEPLAPPGQERAVAAAVAATLAETRPDSLELLSVAAASPWPDLLREAWPGGRPALVTVARDPAPVLGVAGRGYDEWLASRSRHFRKRLQQTRRRLEEAGASIRLAGTTEETAAAVAAFARLHQARWEDRGGSRVVDARVERMLDDVAKELAPATRLRAWVVECDGQPVAVELFLAAGGEVSSWLGGFDPAWADRQPSFQALVAAIEDAVRAGDRRVDLGPGAQSYKLRLADGEEPLRSVVLVPRGPHASLARLDAERRRLRRRLAHGAPKRAKALVRRVRGRA